MRIFSSVSIVCIIFLTLFSTCRKKEKLSFSEFYSLDFSDSLCHNKKMDANELGVDCGGPCEPCTVFELECEPVENVFDVAFFSPRPILSTEIDSSGAEWVYTAYMEGDESISFTIFGRPDISKAYSTENFPNEPGEVKIVWMIPPSSYFRGIGKMLIFYEDGHYVFKACDMVISFDPDSNYDTEFNIVF